MSLKSRNLCSYFQQKRQRHYEIRKKAIFIIKTRFFRLDKLNRLSFVLICQKKKFTSAATRILVVKKEFVAVFYFFMKYSIFRNICLSLIFLSNKHCFQQKIACFQAFQRRGPLHFTFLFAVPCIAQWVILHQFGSFFGQFLGTQKSKKTGLKWPKKAKKVSEMSKRITKLLKQF